MINLSDIKLCFYSFQWQLSGFYDPCIGEAKSLKVRYEFRETMHEVVIRDDEILRIPLQCKFSFSSVIT